MTDGLLLLSGNDIPFLQGGVTIHQPTLKEIAYITEERFWPGCEILKFNKNVLADEDKNGLSNMSNFDILMTMIQEKDVEAQQAKINFLSVLTLLFPTCEIQPKGRTLQLCNQTTGEVGEINNDNFEAFKEIVVEMFCLKSEAKEYDPTGELANKIANQIKRGREKKAKLAPETHKISILSRYLSILAVGECKDLNSLLNYTIYQLMDEFNRFQLKLHYDMFIRFKCAGFSDLKEPDDWFQDVQEKKEKEN